MMQKVLVRGADGERRELALVERRGGTSYVCPLAQFDRAIRGEQASVVGFPNDDVTELGWVDDRKI
jgi:hypothetical protein